MKFLNPIFYISLSFFPVCFKTSQEWIFYRINCYFFLEENLFSLCDFSQIGIKTVCSFINDINNQESVNSIFKMQYLCHLKEPPLLEVTEKSRAHNHLDLLCWFPTTHSGTHTQTSYSHSDKCHPPSHRGYHHPLPISGGSSPLRHAATPALSAPPTAPDKAPMHCHGEEVSCGWPCTSRWGSCMLPLCCQHTTGCRLILMPHREVALLDLGRK